MVNHIYNIFGGCFVKVLVFLTFRVMDNGPRTLRTASMRAEISNHVTIYKVTSHV